MPEIINGKRKVWNPLARYYIEPIGEWIAEKLKKTSVSPNAVSWFNILLGSAAGYLLILGGFWNLILFGVMVRVFHILDIVDGHLARVAHRRSAYGGFLDGIGDRIVVGVWGLCLTLSAFFHSGSALYLLAGALFFFGTYLYVATSRLADVMFALGTKEDALKEELKGNVFSKVFLFFIDNDITWTFLTLAAVFQHPEWFLLFYAMYMNLIWVAYVLYYSYRHVRMRE